MRTIQSSETAQVLLLTVGTGTRDKLEETILEPFRKSLMAAGASRNILLPSQDTEPVARRIQESFPDFPTEIRTLPNAGDENNADRCFEHFDAVLSEVLAAGMDPSHVIADITRGTKAMSAALLMAAAIHGVRHVRYLVGERRNESGSAEPGSEKVRDIEPSFIFLRQNLRLAMATLRAGNFRAAEHLLSPYFPGQSRPSNPVEVEICVLDWAAKFWGAWDRFDYGRASSLLGLLPQGVPEPLHMLLPSEDQRRLVCLLGAALPKAMGERVQHCRALAADLLANAERRLEEGHFEEVLVRIYRLLELITRYRLFSHGIDSEHLNDQHAAVRQWLATQRPGGTAGRRAGSLGRAEAARLLLFVEQKQPAPRGAKIAEKLTRTDELLGVRDNELRNGSILIHGLSASSAPLANKVPRILAAARCFFYEEHEGNQRLHLTARFPCVEFREPSLRKVTP
jgi:CRISPR-associated protein (TIGR02710 family)